MFCIGLTGNIASGKSSVAQIFRQLGIEVIDADQIARQLVAKDKPALQAIIEHFGEVVINDEGELDRRFLRQRIFEDTKERQWLESLLHPQIRQQIEQAIHQVQSTYCVIEIPLLRNKNSYPYLDRVLLVLADRENQLARVIARDHCTRKEALAILNTQADEKDLRAMADDILVNNGSLSQLNQQVVQLHNFYLNYANKKPDNST